MYSVAVYSSKMPLPLSFAEHVWFVISDEKTTDRIEVWAPIWVRSQNTVVVNAMPLYQGFRTTFLDSSTKPRSAFRAKELFRISGESNSSAHKLYKIIKNADELYPCKNTYRLYPGPNSNTFVTWALSHVPEITFKLPKSAIGAKFTFANSQLH